MHKWLCFILVSPSLSLSLPPSLPPYPPSLLIPHSHSLALSIALLFSGSGDGQDLTENCSSVVKLQCRGACTTVTKNIYIFFSLYLLCLRVSMELCQLFKKINNPTCIFFGGGPSYKLLQEFFFFPSPYKHTH